MIRRANSKPQTRLQRYRASLAPTPTAAREACGRVVGRAIAVLCSLASLAACDGAPDAALTPDEGTIGAARQAITLPGIAPRDIASGDFAPNTEHRFQGPKGSGAPKDKLVVFLPASQGQPSDYEEFLDFASRQGF